MYRKSCKILFIFIKGNLSGLESTLCEPLTKIFTRKPVYLLVVFMNVDFLGKSSHTVQCGFDTSQTEAEKKPRPQFRPHLILNTQSTFKPQYLFPRPNLDPPLPKASVSARPQEPRGRGGHTRLRMGGSQFGRL
jgi:hypothetical protein